MNKSKAAEYIVSIALVVVFYVLIDQTAQWAIRTFPLLLTK